MIVVFAAFVFSIGLMVWMIQAKQTQTLVLELSEQSTEKEASDEREQQLEECKTVDQLIRELVEDHQYRTAQIKDRKQMAEKLLEALKREEMIFEYCYIEQYQQFSYLYPNGMSGGIMLKDYDPAFNFTE
ncbi:MAG: hypothetical protein IKP82_06740 [Oscillospiraceae bacterium]|nr:hypothetical protein [Oscillospiraceae bacterium]